MRFTKILLKFKITSLFHTFKLKRSSEKN
jgi:hypothetical protein